LKTRIKTEKGEVFERSRSGKWTKVPGKTPVDGVTQASLDLLWQRQMEEENQKLADELERMMVGTGEVPVETSETPSAPSEIPVPPPKETEPSAPKSAATRAEDKPEEPKRKGILPRIIQSAKENLPGRLEEKAGMGGLLRKMLDEMFPQEGMGKAVEPVSPDGLRVPTPARKPTTVPVAEKVPTAEIPSERPDLEKAPKIEEKPRNLTEEKGLYDKATSLDKRTSETGLLGNDKTSSKNDNQKLIEVLKSIDTNIKDIFKVIKEDFEKREEEDIEEDAKPDPKRDRGEPDRGETPKPSGGNRLLQEFDQNFARRLGSDAPWLNLFTDKFKKIGEIGGPGGSEVLRDATSGAFRGVGSAARGVGSAARGIGTAATSLAKTAGKGLSSLGGMMGMKGVGTLGKFAKIGTGAIPLVGGAIAAGTELAEGGSWGRALASGAGSILGGLGGGAIGSLGGPVGTVAGGVAGAAGGSMLGESIYDYFFGEDEDKKDSRSSKKPEMQSNAAPVTKPTISKQATQLKQATDSKQTAQVQKAKAEQEKQMSAQTTIINNNVRNINGGGGGGVAILPTAGARNSLDLTAVV
jgi:hypothetical protein